MTRLILLAVLTLSYFYVSSQTIRSNCEGTTQVKALYQDDADRLALRETIRTNSSWVDSVEINPALSKQYLDALIAVYNTTSLPERDTVISLLNLHANDPYLDFDGLSIYADTSLNWMQAYKNHQLITGDPFVDGITAKYDLDSSDSFFPGHSSNGSIYLYFSSNKNLVSLGNKFESISGVLQAMPNTYYGSPGKDIEGSINSNFVTLTYHYAWGDCPMGCMYDRYWEFKVYSDCSVEFVKSYGDSFPSNYVSTSEHATGSLSIWPNPFTNQINIDNPFSEAYEYQLYDVVGKIHQTGFVKSNHIAFDDKLPKGQYYLKLIPKSGKTLQFKIIK